MPRRRIKFSPLRRLCYASLLPVVVLLLVESFSWALFGFTFETGFSYRALGEERRARSSEKLRAGAVLFQDVQIPWRRSHVFHPFLGYVRNPEHLTSDHGDRFTTDRFGFLTADPAPLTGPDDPVVIGIFGASFAAMFFQDTQEILAEELGRSPRFAGKTLHFVCGAIGGYKQPQQLMALSYRMLLGDRFDLILNLDGFNEIALYPAVMQKLSMFPAYPRNWQLLSDDRNNYVNRLGEQVGHWRKTRKLTARRLQQSALRSSVTANLLWKLRDRGLEASILEAQERAASPPDHVELSYEQTGPSPGFANQDQVGEELVSLWSRSSIQMRDLAVASGARYYHFLQPNQYVPDSKPMGDGEREVAFEKKPHYGEHARAGYPLLQEQGRRLRDRGVEFVDLTAVFQDVAEPVYIDRCCHINAYGNAIVARAVAAHILASFDD